MAALPEKLLSDEPRLLDVKAAARYLGVSVWTIRYLQWNGHLPVVRLPSTKDRNRESRRLLFDRHDLDQLIERFKEKFS